MKAGTLHSMSDGPGEASAHAAGDAAFAEARAAVVAATGRLAAAGARREVLAAYEPPRRRLGLPRAARMRRLGEVWRLGSLLLDGDGRLYAVGRVVRAEAPARRSVTANAVAEQRAYRAAAVKGGIPAGETVDFDAVPIPLDGGAEALPAGGPVALREGRVMVRWNPSDPGAWTPLAGYLAERAELLAQPAPGT